MLRYIRFADSVSAWFGKAFAWLVLVMTFGIGYEVFVRYVLRDPTAWAFDVSYIMYGALFMIGGAYTLSRNGHVRGDFIYRLWQPRTQAKVEIVLYFLFFFPAIFALIFSGWKFASRSVQQLEVSINSPAGVPVFHFKLIIVAAGVLLLIQGIAQVFRCVIAIRTNAWVGNADDIDETDAVLIREVEQGHVPVLTPEGIIGIDPVDPKKEGPR